MIWVNISNIMKIQKFSGIARTEFELCNYALILKNSGIHISFSTYDPTYGFIEVDDLVLKSVIFNLKNNCVEKENLNRYSKFIRSYKKRINQIKLNCNMINHPFENNDKIFSVGQDTMSGEMEAYSVLKKKINIELNLLCHDLIPINHPYFFMDNNIKLFRNYIDQAIKVVDNFLCNSQYTKRELKEYCGKHNVYNKPMKVIELGCDLHIKIENSEIENNIFDDDKFLIFVSTIEVRKNHRLIYNLYRKLLDNNVKNLPKIYFVGKKGWKVDDFLIKLEEDVEVSKYIKILENISDLELIKLYRNCWFTLFPSFMEGYGLPIAESLAFGKFCLASSAGSLPEVGKDLIDYADPYNLDEWIQKFKFIIANPEYIASKERLIKDKYNPKTWEGCSQQILESF